MQNLFLIPLNKTSSKNVWSTLVNFLRDSINAKENNESNLV